MKMKSIYLSTLLAVIFNVALSSPRPSYNDHYDASNFYLSNAPKGPQDFSSYRRPNYVDKSAPAVEGTPGQRRTISLQKNAMNKRVKQMGDGHFAQTPEFKRPGRPRGRY